MKFIYDKDGKRIAEYYNSSSKDDIEKDYRNIKIFISNTDLGESAFVEGDALRAYTRLDRVLNNTEELQEGEYIENKEIKYKEKPNNFHFWDSKKNLWVYDQELEKSFLEEEIGTLEGEISGLYDELDKAVARKLKMREKQLNEEIKKLNEKIENKYKRYNELGG